MNKMNPVVHFEMPAIDVKRMSDFYTKAFGWQTQMLGEEMGNYVLATTSEMDQKGFPKIPGMINGGFFPVKEGELPIYPNIVIAVDDINESMKDIVEAGGNVLGEPIEIPGTGMYVNFYDTEGNRVCIIQSKIMNP